MMQTLKRFLAISAFLIAVSAPAVRAEPLRVVTSIETFADLARAVGGKHVHVEALARGYQDPHFVEAKPSLLIPLSKADLLVYVGLDLELGWLPPLVQGSRNVRIQLGAKGNLDASTAIDVLDIPSGRVDRGRGDIHVRGNPHYWIPPVNALKVAKEIASRLKDLDPGHSTEYDANLRSFADVLKSRAPEWSKKAAAVRGLLVVPFHKSWTYVATWLGLREIGYVENKPGIPPDPKHLAELILQMKTVSARAILIEPFYNRGIAGQVADSSGATLVVLPNDVGATPHIRAYVDLVDHVLDALVQVAR